MSASLMAHQRALLLVLADKVFTVKELADAAACSVSTIHKAISPEGADMSAYRWGIISRYLCERGELRVAEAFASAEYELRLVAPAEANGSIVDEIREAIESLGDLSQDHRANDWPELDKHVRAFCRIGDRLKAEARMIK
jgi:hypothetical protein